MADRVTIYNRGLNLLGEDEISSSTEDSKRVKAFNSTWEAIVPELLLSQPWLFSIKEERLAKLTTGSITDYGSAYRYPADCITVLEPTSTDVHIRILGDTIYSNSDELTIQYVSDGSDLSKWSVGFARCVSYLLAIENCYKITADNKREERLTDVYYKKVLPESIAADAMQQKLIRVESDLVLGAYED